TAGNLNTSGSLSFTDVDTADTHTASFEAQDAGYLEIGRASCRGSEKGTGGTVGLRNKVYDDATADLTAGQQLVTKNDVTVEDGQGGTATQTIPVTITDTNEAPQITAHTDVPASEHAAFTAGNLNTSGSLSFTDVDTADTHTASFEAQDAGYL